VVGYLATAAASRAAAWTAVGQAGRGVAGVALKEAAAAFKGASFGAANGCGIVGILARRRLGGDICRGQGSDDGAQINARKDRAEQAIDSVENADIGRQADVEICDRLGSEYSCLSA
jgi:hypothetical protein